MENMEYQQNDPNSENAQYSQQYSQEELPPIYTQKIETVKETNEHQVKYFEPIELSEGQDVSKYLQSGQLMQQIAPKIMALKQETQKSGDPSVHTEVTFDLKQNNAIFNLRNFYNTMDYPFWLIVSDRPVDINVYLAQLKLLYNSVPSQAIRKLIREDIDKANLFMSKEVNVTDTEYFILFKEKRPEIIQKRIQNIISGLAGAGLQSAQVSNDDLRVLLDGFMNGGDTTTFGTVMSSI